MFRGKKYKDSAKQIDRSVQYDVADALALVCKVASAKFELKPAAGVAVIEFRKNMA